MKNYLKKKQKQQQQQQTTIKMKTKILTCKKLKVRGESRISGNSLRPNYFIFIGYLKRRGRDGVQVEPLNLLWPATDAAVRRLISKYQCLFKVKDYFR